jgi:hypothetical protein
MKKWFGICLLAGAFLMGGCQDYSGQMVIENKDFMCGVSYGFGYDTGINEKPPQDLEASGSHLLITLNKKCYQQGYTDGLKWAKVYHEREVK